MSRPLRIGLVAGELSGDLLGAMVMDALAAHSPDWTVEGVGGPEMTARGLRSLYPLDTLSVMGFVDPLLRLPQLLAVRRGLYRHFIANPPDVFLGIDSPDFNLPLARRLRHSGVATLHLVSPSVWAWRANRIAKIGRSVDGMLCLFPFEPAVYSDSGIDARYVGHPLTGLIESEPSVHRAREALGLGTLGPGGSGSANGPVLALLPGSRASEVTALGPVFLQAAGLLQQRYPTLHCLLPAADTRCRSILAPLLETCPTLPVTLVDGRSRDAMAAADAVLTASGTATLEAALLRRPMVVAYRMGRLSWRLLSSLVHIDHVALPNILAGRTLVPEFLQDNATPHALAEALCPLLDGDANAAMLAGFDSIRQSLAGDFKSRVAAAILENMPAQEAPHAGPV